MLNKILSTVLALLREVPLWIMHQLLKSREWHRLPYPFSLIALGLFRERLRDKNLFDSAPEIGATGDKTIKVSGWHPSLKQARTADGTYNDLKDPAMGAAGSRFGRNFPLSECHPDEGHLLDPNPRDIANVLLDRPEFRPAKQLNVLAAAWIQFQNHEWFNHKRRPGTSAEDFIDIPLSEADGWPREHMRVECSEADPHAHDSAAPPVFRGSETHWWDGSQIYGSDLNRRESLRAHVDGKLVIADDGLLPLHPDEKYQQGVDLTGFDQNMWAGLSLLHNLFSLEHNAICDRLGQAYPNWSDDQLFETARLVNVALMAKIHTVEWTPAVLDTPTLKTAMGVNWHGLLGGDFRRAFGRVSESEILSGITGSKTDHHGVPYQLTEEFVSVYRLHALIPDDYKIVSMDDGRTLAEVDFGQLQGNNTRKFMAEHKLEDLFYSLGIAHPGAVTLHNFPKALREFQAPERPEPLDLATIDILRDRERGVPRYNRFRELVGKEPLDSFDQLTVNPVWAKELKEIYQGDIDAVDLMIGLYAEEPPAGFGFSDTAFRIFILMASRRLKSDRFFTRDYTPAVYTHEGLEWVERNDFRSVLIRHFPALTPALQNLDNGFKPWDSGI